MIKKVIFIIIVFASVMQICLAQEFFKTADLFHKSESIKNSGSLNIIQEPNVDTLIYRYILANQVLKQEADGDIDGFRIQIYSSSDRNARDESNKIRADFMSLFPDIPSYARYREPGYFLVKAGNFRTKLEGTKWLFLIRKKYPNAILVPDVIYFPDLIKN
jgi:hypothetical protein